MNKSAAGNSPPSDILERAAEVLGYTFENEGVLAEALTHASIADGRLNSNERMEFLGDTILGFVICEYLYNTFPDYLEGDLTKIKSAVVSRKICAQVSQDLDLASMLNLGKGMTSRPALPTSIAAAVLESVVAAIYLDGGIDPARAFVLRHFEPRIREADESAHHFNYKSVLQQHAQKRMTGVPLYILLDEKGPDHSKCFEVCVEVAGRRFPSTWANSKKDAEQQAALIALRELDVLAEEGPLADDDDA